MLFLLSYITAVGGSEKMSTVKSFQLSLSGGNQLAKSPSLTQLQFWMKVQLSGNLHRGLSLGRTQTQWGKPWLFDVTGAAGLLVPGPL